jgi:Flp pilus assembly protein TadD
MATTTEREQLEEHVRGGDLEAVRALTGAILKSVPDDGDALAALARVTAAEGDRAHALELLDRAIGSTPTHVDARVYKAAILLDQRDHDDEARALLEAAAKDAPDHPALRFNLGRALARAGEFRRAAHEIDRAIAGDGENAFYVFARARLDVDMAPGDPAAVERSFERLVQAVKMNPSLVEAWLVIAELQMRGGNARDAVTNLETALQASPEHPMLLDALTNAALASGQTKRAIEVAQKLTASMPENAGALVNLAICFSAAERHGEAEDALRRAIALDPKNARALHTLGMLLEATEDKDAVDEARVLFEEVTEVAPTFWKGFSDLGLLHTVHEAHMDLPKARKLLEKAKELSGGRPEPLMNLALCAAKQGAKDAAQQHIAALLAHPLATEAMKDQARALKAAVDEA